MINNRFYFHTGTHYFNRLFCIHKIGLNMILNMQIQIRIRFGVVNSLKHTLRTKNPSKIHITRVSIFELSVHKHFLLIQLYDLEPVKLKYDSYHLRIKYI